MSPGLDQITTKLIKSVDTKLAPVLANLFNEIVNTGTYPTALKRVKTFPIFKGGDCNDFNNYRFICVVPVFSKIFEYLMFNRIIEFINNNNLISNKQFGFMPKSNTSIACIEFIDA